MPSINLKLPSWRARPPLLKCIEHDFPTSSGRKLIFWDEKVGKKPIFRNCIQKRLVNVSTLRPRLMHRARLMWDERTFFRVAAIAEIFICGRLHAGMRRYTLGSLASHGRKAETKSRFHGNDLQTKQRKLIISLMFWSRLSKDHLRAMVGKNDDE